MGTAVLCLYALLIVWTARKPLAKAGARAFYLNNRASSAVEIGLSIVVSCVGASATMGMVGMAFETGTPAFWWLGMGAVGLTVLSLVLAKKVRQTGASTLPELVERYLGKPSRPLVSILIIIAWLAILAAQFSAATNIISSMTGLPRLICLGLGFALVVGHTFGGLAAIMRTDRVQAWVLFAALAAILVWMSVNNPGWADGVRLEAVNSGFPPSQLVYYFFVVGANYLVCPTLFSRFLSARDEKTARRGGFLGAAGLLLSAVLIVSVGLACTGLVPIGTPSDKVLTVALADIMPGWMNLVVCVALLSAVVSSADSCLVTVSTVLCHDLIKRQGSKTIRVSVLIFGLAAIGVSLLGKGILKFLLMAYDVYACGVVLPVFTGMLLGGKRRVLAGYAAAAICTGGILGAAAALTEEAVFSYAGMALSALLIVLGSRGLEKENMPGAGEVLSKIPETM